MRGGARIGVAAGRAAEECRILNSLGPALTMTGDPEAGIAMLARARVLAEEIGDPEELTRSYINLAEMLDQAGRLAEAVEVNREGVAMARREGIPGRAADAHRRARRRA